MIINRHVIFDFASFALAGVLMAVVPLSASAANLLAHWHLNESGPPYIDAAKHAIVLAQDGNTSPALVGMGIEGSAAILHVDAPPVSTRLYSDHTVLQRNTFGFSFWINPVSINPFDNLLAKEMAYDNSVPNDERLAWQVHILNDNGDGSAAVEFLVRGDDRGLGNYFGAVTSVVSVPLSTHSAKWIHIAGGYDAMSGELSLYVNGVESIVGGIPGAQSSDGSALSVGSARNGGDAVAFSATTIIEDLQFYDQPFGVDEVEFLLQNPGKSIDPEFSIQGASVHSTGGDLTVRFNTVSGGGYFVEAATDLANYSQLTMVESSVNFVHDAGTAGPWSVDGREGDSVLLRWNDPPGVATRLFANNPLLQADSFGFSFWIRPHNLNPWDNLIAKEMAFDNSVPDWSRMAWQLHLLGDNGFGAAQLELVVRGANRAVTNFYGLVASDATIPLYTDSPDWFHIAGGYDALSGNLSLYVNGAGYTAGGLPGAHNSDGSPLAIGTVRNGGDFVQFAAVTRMDDLQIYQRPLSAAQVVTLMSWPGLTMEYFPALVARWRLNEPSPPYLDSAQARGIGAVQISKAMLDAAFGASAASNVFFRVYETPPAKGFNACE